MSTAVKGLLGTKLGMTQIWDENNKVVPVTVVKAGPCVVTQVRTPESDGYSAVQLGYGQIDPTQGEQADGGALRQGRASHPRRHLVELRTDAASEVTVGQEFDVTVFEPGARVDVTGTTKGKGYAGVMKRHGFHGLRASHGVQRKHRSPGSIGGCATPGRVFKGLRMAGRMGGDRQTTLNLTVERVDHDNGVLLIRGALPGSDGSIVFIREAKKGSV
ncbi:MAG: 50S ribosomal protein L3 [Candidatus Nanopelagicales bacterium]